MLPIQWLYLSAEKLRNPEALEQETTHHSKMQTGHPPCLLWAVSRYTVICTCLDPLTFFGD